MKRTLLFILLFLPMLPLEVKAHYEVFDDILYNFNDYTLTASVEGSEDKKINGNVNIPDTITYNSYIYKVTTIASYAFRNCTKITSIKIPDSVTNIGCEAFYGCTGLTSITIPIGVKGIGGGAFTNCTNLTSIEVAEGNPVFDSRENCNAIIQTASNTLILGCQNSTIPNSVTTIRTFAFGNCIGLTSITIPNSVISIESVAFSGCSNLSSVIIGGNVESIETNAFEFCSSLTSVVIPNNVKTMGEYAFRECTSLSSVIIGDGVKNIERLTFLCCTNLSSVTIGNSVERIKEGAFDHCSNLTSINIPNNVTTIGRDAFQECSNLSSVVIGNSVTSIGEQAFRLCSKLDNFYSYAEQVPECHWSSFSGSNYKATLHVPATSVSAYQAAEPWKNFKEIVALTEQGDETDDSDYIPFVEMGKQWHVVRTSFGAQNYHSDTYMMNEEVVKDGKTYLKMYRSEDDLTVVYDAGLLREEDRKVYIYDADKQEEHLIFDYSLKAGDTYEAYSSDENKMLSYKVVSVGDCTECPRVRRFYYDENADSTVISYRKLRQWTVCRTDNESIQKTWIEGVGSLEGPLENLYDNRPVSSRSYLAYVFFNDIPGGDYFPFSFYDTLNRNIHGCDLPKTASYISEDWHSHMTYELEGDRLHVYGQLVLNCGCYNYAYFFEEPTDDPLVHKLHFEIQDVGEPATCVNLFDTDFYVLGFDPNLNYIVVDNNGEEHPVINKTPQNEYRPFVEDGKVWKVGASGSGNPVQIIEYYYFDGDTVVGGKTCKQMMRQRFVSPDFPEYDIYSQQPSLNYVGAWYEEDKKVYEYDSIRNQLKLMYDFSVNANDTLEIDNLLYVIGPKQTGGMKGFKGIYRDILMYKDGGSIVHSTPWLEGVGGVYGPTINVFDGELADPMWFLMSCTVGDEVIYLNDEFEDGATPEAMNARKRFDFTHTTKLQPKTPRRSEEEQSLYGEYNDKQLGINLDPLDEAYLVRITDETGKTVYEKAIDTGNIVALNVDISAYAKGRYTVTVENSNEAFTGEFEVQTTGIEEISSKRSEVRDYIYNLQGQRLTSLQKGLNIVNGKKVYVK